MLKKNTSKIFGKDFYAPNPRKLKWLQDTIIKCNENKVQARKLNEPVGFLVSSLNNLGSW